MKLEYKIIALSAILASLSWTVDAVLDYLLYHEGTFWELLITDVPAHEVYDRGVATALFVVFGVLISRVLLKRKKADEALRESETKYRQLIENMQEGIWVIDENSYTTFVNPHMAHILGYTIDEMQGKHLFDFMDEHGIEICKHLLERRRQGIKEQLDFEFIRKDGKQVYASLETAPILDDEGNYVGAIACVMDITERKRMEEALRESEEKYRGIFDESVAATYAFDAKKNFIDSNQSGLALMGYSREELLSMSIPDVDADPVAVLPAHAQLLSGENIVNYEHRLKCKDGRIITVLNNSRPLTDVQGNVVGMQSTLIDITERKQMEEALRESEQKYRSLFENMLNGFAYCQILVDENNRPVDFVYIEVNDAFERLTGLKKENVVGKKVTEAIPGIKEAHPELFDIYGKVALTGEEDQFDIHFEPLDIWLSISVYSPGKGYFVAVFENITERKQMEEALQESEQKYRELYETAPVMLYTLDDKGVLLDCNKAFSEVVGYSKEVMISKPVSEFETQASGRLAAEAQERLLREGSLRGERDFINRDGNIVTIEYDAHTEYDDEQQGILIKTAAKDINERKRAEEELTRYRYNLEERVAERTADLRNANARLREEINESKRVDEKLQALYEQERVLRQNLEVEMKKRVEFTRALAHELKTPLTPVMMSSQALVSQLKKEPLASLARNVSRGASNLNDRIDELLDLAKGEIGMLQLKARSLDMRQLLEEAINDVAALASSRGQSLVSELPPTLPKVRADEVRSRQIVMNLLNNALKFTPEGGKITLRAREEDAEVTVEVQDTGPGITRKEQKQIFVPYHHQKGDTERQCGLGLGLALCKTLVELHGGQIWVKSRPGKGSTFGFSFPLEAAK